jgi:hypothetical protein
VALDTAVLRSSAKGPRAYGGRYEILFGLPDVAVDRVGWHGDGRVVPW